MGAARRLSRAIVVIRPASGYFARITKPSAAEEIPC